MKFTKRKSWCKCAYDIALIFLTFSDLLGDLGNKTEKIEIEMKEMRETLSSLTTTVEKSTNEGWLQKKSYSRINWTNDGDSVNLST